MSDRLLPGKDEFEKSALDQVVGGLNTLGISVMEITKGDTVGIPFDWLVELADGSGIGLEVVRAEDQGQVHHIEKRVRAGDTVITGTAEMPWDSLSTAVNKKLLKAGGYREALGQLYDSAELHLAVISGLQQLHLEGALAEQMEGIARSALEVFDTVWLIQGDSAQRLI